MTHLLVRVRDAPEAAQAAAAEIDAVELFLTGATAADLSLAKSVRADFPGPLRLRFAELGLMSDLVQFATLAEADEIALGLDAIPTPKTIADAFLQPKLRSVAILPTSVDIVASIEKVRGRVDAVMLDTGQTARLIDHAGIATLDAFASACRENRLSFGLAGGLEAPDVARLLLLEPDMLGFDTAIRLGHDAKGNIDPEALDAIRALVPRDRRDTTSKPALSKVIDRIFVSDFEISLAVGAYQAERSARQRVRFSVVAEIIREPLPPRDMRDVFSYDVIIETIRVLAERAHITFVETLAEEVASSLLARDEVVAVNVKVEKLDVISGAVGIEIVRRRIVT